MTIEEGERFEVGRVLIMNASPAIQDSVNYAKCDEKNHHIPIAFMFPGITFTEVTPPATASLNPSSWVFKASMVRSQGTMGPFFEFSSDAPGSRHA